MTDATIVAVLTAAFRAVSDEERANMQRNIAEGHAILCSANQFTDGFGGA